MQLTWGPGLARVVAVKFNDVTSELLVVEPKALSILPLQDGQVVTRANGFNDAGATPGSGIFDESDTAIEIAIVDLELHVAEDDSADRRASRHFSRVEVALGNFYLKSDR